jgi:hypothetical protein
MLLPAIVRRPDRLRRLPSAGQRASTVPIYRPAYSASPEKNTAPPSGFRSADCASRFLGVVWNRRHDAGAQSNDGNDPLAPSSLLYFTEIVVRYDGSRQ